MPLQLTLGHIDAGLAGTLQRVLEGARVDVVQGHLATGAAHGHDTAIGRNGLQAAKSHRVVAIARSRGEVKAEGQRESFNIM